MREAVIPAIESKVAIDEAARAGDRAGRIGLQSQGDDLDRGLELLLDSRSGIRLLDVRLRLGPVDPRLLLDDLFLQRPHRIEVLFELFLIAFSELAIQRFRLIQDHIENALMAFEAIRRARLLLR